MSNVYVVDKDATGLARDLNGVSRQHHYGTRFEAILTPENLFERLAKHRPDLILLHHHWPGLTISELLSRIGAAQDDVRVVVFTGQVVEIRELIECVRSGVADYWAERSRLEPEWICRRIDHYCSSEAWTVRALKRPSESTLQLLVAAEATEHRNEVLETQNTQLTARLSNENNLVFQRAAVSAFKILFSAFVVAVMFFLVKLVTSSDWISLGVAALIALFGLLFDGRIAEAMVSWRGASATVRTDLAIRPLNSSEPNASREAEPTP